MQLDTATAFVQVSDLIKDICRSLKKENAAGMPVMYLQAMQNSFQRHLDDDQSQSSMQEFTALCTRVAQTYAGFNTSATALLHIAKVGSSPCLPHMCGSLGASALSHAPSHLHEYSENNSHCVSDGCAVKSLLSHLF